VRPKRRVLVVEDEWLLASEISGRLQEAGFEVIGPSPSVRDALNLMETATPDAAMLDCQLLGETSFEIAARLAEKSIPYFFLSGHSRSDFADELGGAAVLAKPVDWMAVMGTLRKMLGEA
jgi:DNA-binding response OmpR family regulator